MQKSVNTLEKGKIVPFGMRFMESPTKDDKSTLNSSVASTVTTVYTTESGAWGGLDDGQSTSRDD